MAKNYVDKRRNDRLNERSIQLRNKELVRKLDAYCLLNDIKITQYVENAVMTKLSIDIANMNKQMVIDSYEN